MDLDKSAKLTLNYRFKVLIDNQPVSFAKVTGLNMNVETEMISEGGHNGTGYILEVPAKSSNVMRLERGIYKKDTSILAKLRPGMYLNQGVVVMVLGPGGEIQIKYSAERAVVTKWEVSELNAENGQVLVSTFEIAYTRLALLD
ncbi:MAG: phage tail protein [Lachnospiraceae bacterium]|nr:phage tail protein [Lachnospiraceae bacterium]MDE6626389.1 phage tail protein [Lachnospiraceae bacterium]